MSASLRPPRRCMNMPVSQAILDFSIPAQRGSVRPHSHAVVSVSTLAFTTVTRHARIDSRLLVHRELRGAPPPRPLGRNEHATSRPPIIASVIWGRLSHTTVVATVAGGRGQRPSHSARPGGGFRNAADLGKVDVATRTRVVCFWLATGAVVVPRASGPHSGAWREQGQSAGQWTCRAPRAPESAPPIAPACAVEVWLGRGQPGRRPSHNRGWRWQAALPLIAGSVGRSSISSRPTRQLEVGLRTSSTGDLTSSCIDGGP